MKYLLSLLVLCGTMVAQPTTPYVAISITEAGSNVNAPLLTAGKTYDADGVGMNGAQLPASPHAHGMITQTFYALDGTPLESIIISADVPYWTGSFVPSAGLWIEDAATSILTFTVYWRTLAEPDIIQQSSTSRQVLIWQ